MDSDDAGYALNKWNPLPWATWSWNRRATELDIIMHSWNSRSTGAEGGGLQFQGQLGQLNCLERNLVSQYEMEWEGIFVWRSWVQSVARQEKELQETRVVEQEEPQAGCFPVPAGAAVQETSLLCRTACIHRHLGGPHENFSCPYSDVKPHKEGTMVPA